MLAVLIKQKVSLLCSSLEFLPKRDVLCTQGQLYCHDKGSYSVCAR